MGMASNTFSVSFSTIITISRCFYTLIFTIRRWKTDFVPFYQLKFYTAIVFVTKKNFTRAIYVRETFWLDNRNRTTLNWHSRTQWTSRRWRMSRRLLKLEWRPLPRPLRPPLLFKTRRHHLLLLTQWWQVN